MKKKTGDQIKSFVDSACFESAAMMLHDFNETGSYCENDINEKIKELKRLKVRDIQGALADFLYDDVDTLCDLIGDQVYEGAETAEERLALIDELSGINPKAIEKLKSMEWNI